MSDEIVVPRRSAFALIRIAFVSAFAALGALLAIDVAGAGAASCHKVAAPNCDFGDAPDGNVAYSQGPGREDDIIGNFPSLRTSQGSAHARVFPAPLLRLGSAIDPEGDSKQINIDSGDDGFSRRLTRCKTGKIKFKVDTRRIPRGMLTRKHKIYLNFWSDWNFDGDWRDTDTRCGKKKSKKKKRKGKRRGGRALISAKGSSFGDDLSSKKALRRLKSAPVPEWRVRNFAVSAARFARKRVITISLPVRAGGQVADFGPKKGQSLAPFECHRAVVTLDERFAGRVRFPDLNGRRGANDGRGSFQLGETEDYCPFSAPFGPPPPPGSPPGSPPNGPTGSPSGGDANPGAAETSKTVDVPPFANCDPGFFIDIYIPPSAQEPITHEIIGGPPCENATIEVQKYEVGEEPPSSFDPDEHWKEKKTYRVIVFGDAGTNNPFDIKVSWQNP